MLNFRFVHGLFGTAGELEVAVKSVRAVDGTIIYLSGLSLLDEGSDKLVVFIVLAFLLVRLSD